MAFHGKHVIVYDAIPAGLERGRAFHREYAEHFIKHRSATREQIDDLVAILREGISRTMDDLRREGLWRG